MRWRKIKITPENKVFLEYQEPAGEFSWNDLTFQCSDPGRPEFYDAFKALAEHVVDMCELPVEDLDKLKITVKGVSFSYGGENEVMGATISASRKLERSNSPLNLVTPHKPSEPYGKGQDEDLNGLLDPDCVDALKALQAEAFRYLKGERAQVDLFADEAEPAAKVEA